MKKEEEETNNSNEPLNTSVPMECPNKLYLVHQEVCILILYNIYIYYYNLGIFGVCQIQFLLNF